MLQMRFYKYIDYNGAMVKYGTPWINTSDFKIKYINDLIDIFYNEFYSNGYNIEYRTI